jgi:hypothetical protein
MSRTLTAICPFCHAEHDRSGAIVEKKAKITVEPKMKPGDASLCIDCGQFAIMAEDGMLRRPTGRERRALQRNPIVTATREAWIAMQQQRARRQ